MEVNFFLDVYGIKYIIGLISLRFIVKEKFRESGIYCLDFKNILLFFFLMCIF